MRYGVLNGYGRGLANGAALLLLGGLAASCSSGAARFSDGLLTGSTRPKQDLQRPVQAFPGDVAPAAAVDNVYTGANAAPSPRSGVQRTSLGPVAGSAQAAPLPARPLDASSTGSTVRQPKVAELPPTTAKPTRQTLPDGKTPLPQTAPAKVAVLRDAPKAKDGKAAGTGTDASPAKAKAKAGTYTVAAGDTMNRIAKAHGVTAGEIKAANGMTSGALRIGQVLTIPGGATAPGIKIAAAPKVDPIVTGTAGPVKGKGDKPKAQPATVTAYTPPAKKTNMAAVEEADKAAAPIATGIGKMRWPVRGRVVSGYGSGEGADGIDIAVPEGTPVKAAENGVVIYAGNGLKDFGNTVLVRHADGLVTVYGHADALKVSRGDTVKRGQEIATSGMSGATDTPKLHFEVRKNSAAVDPTKFLE